MSHDDLERRIRQMVWPTPSEALRARVLSSAAPAPSAATWADRVWFSRAWRLGAAGVVAALVAFEAWSAPPRASSVVGRQVMSSSALALDDLLPAGTVVALTSRGPDPGAWPALPSPDLTGDPR